MTHAEEVSGPPQTAGIAVASLVLGILGLFSAGLTALAAVICGHLARGKIESSRGRLSGGGLAIGGLITGYLGMFWAVVLVSAYFYTTGAKEQGGTAVANQCAAREVEIGRACQAYAKDHNGSFPRSLDDLVPQYVPDKSLFACPMMAGDPNHPAIGYKYYGGNSKDPADQLLLISLGTTSNHLKVLLFVDGSTQILKDSDVQLPP